MRSVDAEQPAIVEIVEGRRYLFVVGTPKDVTASQRERIRDVVKANIPKDASLLVLPHGLTFDVYEDDVR